MSAVEIVLPEWSSLSGYELTWDATGLRRAEARSTGKDGWVVPATVRPGDYIFAHYYDSDSADYAILLRVPADGADFRTWAHLAADPHQYLSWLLDERYVVWLWDLSYYGDVVLGGEYAYTVKPWDRIRGLPGADQTQSIAAVSQTCPHDLEEALRLTCRS